MAVLLAELSPTTTTFTSDTVILFFLGLCGLRFECLSRSRPYVVALKFWVSFFVNYYLIPMLGEERVEFLDNREGHEPLLLVRGQGTQRQPARTHIQAVPLGAGQRGA